MGNTTQTRKDPRGFISSPWPLCGRCLAVPCPACLAARLVQVRDSRGCNWSLLLRIIDYVIVAVLEHKPMRWILSVCVPHAGGRGGQYFQTRVPRGGGSSYCGERSIGSQADLIQWIQMQGQVRLALQTRLASEANDNEI